MTDLEWTEKWIASVEKKLKNAESRGDETGIENLKETLRRLNSIADVLAVWEGLKHESNFTG